MGCVTSVHKRIYGTEDKLIKGSKVQPSPSVLKADKFLSREEARERRIQTLRDHRAKAREKAEVISVRALSDKERLSTSSRFSSRSYSSNATGYTQSTVLPTIISYPEGMTGQGTLREKERQPKNFRNDPHSRFHGILLPNEIYDEARVRGLSPKTDRTDNYEKLPRIVPTVIVEEEVRSANTEQEGVNDKEGDHTAVGVGNQREDQSNDEIKNQVKNEEKDPCLVQNSEHPFSNGNDQQGLEINSETKREEFLIREPIKKEIDQAAEGGPVKAEIEREIRRSEGT